MNQSNTENPFKRFHVPMIRRIYPQLIASQIVSVQPLGPSAAGEYEIPTEFPKRKVKKYRSIDEPWGE